MNETATQHK